MGPARVGDQLERRQNRSGHIDGIEATRTGIHTNTDGFNQKCMASTGWNENIVDEMENKWTGYILTTRSRLQGRRSWHGLDGTKSRGREETRTEGDRIQADESIRNGITWTGSHGCAQRDEIDRME